MTRGLMTALPRSLSRVCCFSWPSVFGPYCSSRRSASSCVRPCGELWNFWNSCAGGQLEYLAPFNAGPALFGFSAIAYPVFALFALEAYALASLATYPRSGRTWEEGTWTMPGKPPHVLLPLLAYCLIIISLYIALRATDACTVVSRLGWI